MKSGSRPLMVIIEPSDMVYEGLCALIAHHGIHVLVKRMHDPEEIVPVRGEEPPVLVVMNPSLALNRQKWFRHFTGQYPGTRWFALVYCRFAQELLSPFDGVIDISSSGLEIAGQITGALTPVQETESQSEQLSAREKEVLLLLVQGLQNKEIADQLHISIHTVISHRKNLTQKTGIRSQAGLVIYAISNKLVPIESLGK
jgi:DNA-binding CsgD family transcriptional regulator